MLWICLTTSLIYNHQYTAFIIHWPVFINAKIDMHFLDLNKLENNIILAKVHYKDQKKADGIYFQPSFN